MAEEPNGSHGRNTHNITVIASTTSVPVSTYDPREYYKTYDVMTGIRIAATLGSFFGLMVLLVLYKSKSKTEKALEDPNFTAAAVAEVEEEERQIQLAMEDIVYQQLNPRRSSRRSLETSSAPHGFSRSSRFSSIGGYSSLLEPPIRVSPRLPCFIDEDSPPEDGTSIYDEVYYNSHLNVPRRPSNITCSSSGSSYLERRDSAVTLGLPALPAHKFKSSRRPSSPLPEIYDFYYPIDIRVTQPTPGGSPCGSDRAIYDRVDDQPKLKPRIAPLASISSCNSSLGTEYMECEGLSYVDSSSLPDEEDENTDNEIDPFSTDSDANSETSRYATGPQSKVLSGESSSTPTPGTSHGHAEDKSSCRLADFIRSSKSSSTLLENTPLPQLTMTDVHRLSASSSKLDKYSWAQETLF
ncbi:uncharacterized protein LOC132704856 [Cylas formicarius]|uniref:uncharacterized protein LOC132704856 n=1 Tax=Cylas formicarius TaxID=197179 RepID=UPI0029587AA9|nr:uncharacterized protein LOC132704856 [Cylas formicarius]XP_060531131.1 uncharacterized protein LOC132704856 [Cylas formicarius]XP_060531132.1 uncharacterized protein LOC132704856 [Cylas formicarius]XP_060531133.1 uncharacterized protein LOC132704856 [Cylas formicarius]